MTHKEFVLEGQMVTREFYLEVLGHLLKRIVQVRLEAWKNCSFYPLHNNLPTTRIVQQCLMKKRVAVLSHLVYSPDLSPPDYFISNCKTNSTKMRKRQGKLRILGIRDAGHKKNWNCIRYKFQSRGDQESSVIFDQGSYSKSHYAWILGIIPISCHFLVIFNFKIKK